MKITRGIKRIFKPFVNVSAWMDTERLGEQTKSLGDSLKSMAVPKQAHTEESFEEAVARLNFSEQDIQERMSDFHRIATIIFIITILILGYAIYLFVENHTKGGIVALAVSGLAFAQGFKFHFWYFQLRKRKFGCTFTEWLREGLLG